MFHKQVICVQGLAQAQRCLPNCRSRLFALRCSIVGRPCGQVCGWFVFSNKRTISTISSWLSTKPARTDPWQATVAAMRSSHDENSTASPTVLSLHLPNIAHRVVAAPS